MTAAFVPVLLWTVAAAGADDLAALRARIVAHEAAAAPDASYVRQLMGQLRRDGTWPDIDYASKLRGSWATLEHLRRVLPMARAYAAKGHPLARQADLREAVRRGLAHWTDRAYRNSNWWYGRIGVPRDVAPILLLMGDALPAELQKQAYDRLLAPSKMGMTGQNKVWVAGIALMKGLLRNDPELVARARDAIFRELRVTTAEGIQPDASFHQHGPQQQWGNYGSSFGGDMVRWAAILQGTPYAPSADQLAVLRTYLLAGPSWIVWRGRMDMSGCGRQLRPDCLATKGGGIMRHIENLAKLDPSAKEACALRLRSWTGKGPNELVGHRHYWRSDISVHRRPTWYASVKMCSKRVIGAETCNSENLQGLHLGDGAMYVMRSGREYEDIFAVWDWTRLPGVTCLTAGRSLVPSSRRCRGRSEFVGGVSDGERGLAVMHYLRGQVQARKAWFFLTDRVVCLGAGITSGEDGLVRTAMIQRRLAGNVTCGTAKSSATRRGHSPHRLTGPAWVFHDGVGYALTAKQSMTVSAGEQAGDWNDINRRGRKRPARMDILSAWIDHGQRPAEAGYAYAVFPQASAQDMPGLLSGLDGQILSRSADLLAVADDGGRTVLAAFFAPDTLTVAGKPRLTVDQPCVALLDGTRTPPRLHLADPTHKLEALTVRVNGGPPRRLALPTGPRAGQTTTAP